MHKLILKFATGMYTMYDKASFSVQINDYVARSLPIQCSLRQDCLVSMLIFALVSNPLYKSVGAVSYEHKLDITQRKPRWWHREGQSPGERRIRSGPISKTRNPVRAYPSTLQDMA
jgi:hypothetical protein